MRALAALFYISFRSRSMLWDLRWNAVLATLVNHPDDEDEGVDACNNDSIEHSTTEGRDMWCCAVSGDLAQYGTMGSALRTILLPP